MFNKLGPVSVTVVLIMTASPVLGQAPNPSTGQPPAPTRSKLTGDHEKRANQLDEEIDKSTRADRWDEAIGRAKELLALRMRTRGAKHSESVSAEWRLKTLLRVAAMPKENRLAWQEADASSERAKFLFSLRRYPQAQTLHEKALEIRRRLFNDEHPETAESYHDLATCLQAQGKYADARPLLEKALLFRLQLLTDGHPDTAESCYHLAQNMEAQGLFAEAYSLYEKALEIRLRALGDNHPDTAITYDRVAKSLDALGKHSLAQPLFEKALGICRRLLGDDHSQTANVYDDLAANLYAQGRYLEAKDRWAAAVKSHDAARLRVAVSERVTALRSLRPALAAILARLGQPAEAWQALEENLGHNPVDELAARQDRRLSSTDRARLRESTAELDKLARLVEAMPAWFDQPVRAGQSADLIRQLESVKSELSEFQNKLDQQHGALAGAIPTLDEIQLALPADAALVAWVDIEPPGPKSADPDGEHWVVVVRSRGVPVWVSIAGTGKDGLWTKADAALAGQVQSALKSRPGPGARAARPLIQRLRAQRLEPLAKALGATADRLPPARRLIVLPSRAMAGIPVEALLAVDDTRAVSYVSCATVYKYLREQPQPDPHAGLLALGAPVGSAPLPGARGEIEAIAALFKADNRPTRILVETDASEPELDRIAASGELGRFGFIHLATHGVIDDDAPDRSAVILTQTGLPDPLAQAMANKPVYDGRISAREIKHGWELKAELVTVSASETTLGRDAGSEGFLGFAQAFLATGARSACLSLWKSDDRATALFMQRFYANLLGMRRGLTAPMPKAEALREAKAWLRGLRRDAAVELGAHMADGYRRVNSAAKPDLPAPAAAVPVGSSDEHPFEHPHFWAAFVLVGDPD
jgi:CHAT domain-containing protein/tetratricopeptide (TPR) repeat protein